ncbi:MAG: UDP-N-acetylmuramate dehydrogenase [Clostridia bacterium]|nr:UDP-N-acetylmuramate dehydrogenase [Clostridia bacterium]
MRNLQRALDALGIPCQTDCDLKKHSSFRIGGCADLGVFPQNREQLTKVLTLIRASEIPYLVIGKGSNVVFSDEGFTGAVIFTEGCRTVTREGNELLADAGVPLVRLATYALESSLGGAEFLHGIPGSLGGAVFMNAGAYGSSVSDVCICSEYFDPDTETVITLRGEAQRFSVRSSIYTDHPQWVILGARLALTPADPAEIRAKMEELASRRRTSQPLELPSAGSVFKRPVGHYAGKLIEDCGLKGYRIGDAEVSVKHAGFIVNRGNASAADVRRLVEHIRKTVLTQTGVTLECEIRFL